MNDVSDKSNDSLSYSPKVTFILERLTRLFVDRRQDIILAKMNVPNNALREFAQNNDPGFCQYPDLDQRVDFWDKLNKERIAICDDSVPQAYLSELDQGLYAGLFNADVRFLCDTETGWISSMVPPLLNDLKEIAGLSFTKESIWYHRYIDQLRKFVRRADGKFGISHFILINGLNFVFELIGATQTYIEMMERPKLVAEAMELAYRVNLHIQSTFFEYVPLVRGGTCSNMIQWAPGKIISESLDPFHMTGPEYFEKWGAGPVERIFSDFDGGVIHIHSNGRHLLEAASRLKGLKAICLQDEPQNPPAFECLEELKSKTANIPLVCSAPLDRFSRLLQDNKLPGGVFYDVTDVPDIDTANRTMELVREYRA